MTEYWPAGARTGRPARGRPEAPFALAIEAANEGLWEWDLLSGRLKLSQRWYELLGLTPTGGDESVNAWFNRVHPEDLATLRQTIDRHRAVERGLFRHEFRVLHADGEYRWMAAQGLVARNTIGRPERIAGSLKDVSEGRLFDPLTGLPNRFLLTDRIATAMERMASDPDYGFAVLIADLNRFKRIHLSLGPNLSDAVLQSVAGRLQEALACRSSGPYAGDLVARLGTDEFAILLEATDGVLDALRVAEGIQLGLKRPMTIDGQDVFATASVGIVVGERRHTNSDVLLQEAITAAHRAKGRIGGAAVYDHGMHSHDVHGLKLESDLRRAVGCGSIGVHYQPIVDLNEGRIVGLEALARWDRPGHGDVSPAKFIPVAEESDLIHGLGGSILAQACRQMAEWWRMLGPGNPVFLSVNISARQLIEPGLFDQIHRTLKDTGLPAKALKLEVTESVVMGNAPGAQQTLNRLKTLGIALAIDDFGTGYSSLSYLHRLPFDEVKIDKSFVGALEDDDESHAIVDTILTLAKKLRFSVVAEGVENTQQRDQLIQLGCRTAQGFLWSKAVSPLQVPELLMAPRFV